MTVLYILKMEFSFPTLVEAIYGVKKKIIRAKNRFVSRVIANLFFGFAVIFLLIGISVYLVSIGLVKTEWVIIGFAFIFLVVGVIFKFKSVKGGNT